ncbi:protein-disulfide reductase DsbD family protein [Gammaproteobacteria bacterium]|nr:protein-disulfide reductase DsbD family protein [Gammaproteobacteria bacterium]
MLTKRLPVLLVLSFAMSLTGLVKPQIYSTDQIEVELLAEPLQVVPGESFWLAIRLDPLEGWHTYWKFGGDSGEATNATDWILPEGVSVGDIIWPMPDWTPFPDSNLVTFTYEHEVFLPIPVVVPSSFDQDEFTASTLIEWQVCDEICIPGKQEFSLTLPVADQTSPDPRWSEGFGLTRKNLPLKVGQHQLSASFNSMGDAVNVMVASPDEIFVDAEDAWFFPTERRIMQYAPTRNVIFDGDRVQITTAQHRRFPEILPELDGLLTFVDSRGVRHGYDIKPTRSQVAWDYRIELQLMSELPVLVPGVVQTLGLRLKPEQGWHTYWKMGGDSGEPTKLESWQAPGGTLIGELQFPAPHWLPFYETDLVNFGYEEEILLPIEVTLPTDFSEESATFSAVASWNVCEQICIPGEQILNLTVPVARTQDESLADPLFAETERLLPQKNHNITSIIASAGSRVSLGFESSEAVFDGVSDAYFFPTQRRILKPGPLREVALSENLLQITHQQPRRMLEDLSAVYGVLVLEGENGKRASFEFADPAIDAGNSVISPLDSSQGEAGGFVPSKTDLIDIGLYMFFAFLGGLILNLMPCVFPVLSMKALSFAKNVGASQKKQRLDGIAYTVGVISAFLALASILIILRAGGEQIGWAFQFQQPWFLAVITYVFFILALSLSGVFEIGTSLMGAGSGLAQKEGYTGSFFTGVLATTVATPCTAPFMGPALGFALTQPWVIAMLVFIALGFGMALPILLLAYLPTLSRFLPRPGSWMETFKQFMAFPLYASSLFFLWVLGNQVGTTGMTLVLGVCLLLAFTVWLYQRRNSMALFGRMLNYGFAIGSLSFALYLLQTPFLSAPRESSASTINVLEESDRDFEAFSTAKLNDLRAAGRPVFVNMTADWCITCLANEQTSLGTERVKNVMRDEGITYLKGDWTNEDPQITEILEEFNRPSVPLYLYYPPHGEPEILPQILTPGTLVEVFEGG